MLGLLMGLRFGDPSWIDSGPTSIDVSTGRAEFEIIVDAPAPGGFTIDVTAGSITSNVDPYIST